LVRRLEEAGTTREEFLLKKLVFPPSF